MVLARGPTRDIQRSVGFRSKGTQLSRPRPFLLVNEFVNTRPLKDVDGYERFCTTSTLSLSHGKG
eukprot:1494708-Pleurochrysis_carterae.AAC.1